MDKLGGGVGLAHEAGQVRRVARPPSRHHLQGHVSVEGQLMGEIDCAHPAPAQLLEHSVTTKRQRDPFGGFKLRGSSIVDRGG